ncbi:MAG: META domain-containing protein [Chloroflexota bacterium]
MTLLLVLVTWCLAPLGARAGSPAPGASDAPAPDLEGVQWLLTQVVLDGSLVGLPPDAPAATMQLWHGYAFGNGGCNAWSASYALDASAITFADPRTTRRQCLVAAPAEGPLLDALPRIASWSIADRLLTLADGQGARLLVARSDIQPSTGIRGVWRIAGLAAADSTPVDPLSLGQASASFGGGQFRATVGCNWITGTYTQDGSTLHIEPGFRTMMGCAGLAEPEEVLWDALLAVVSAAIDEDAVVLLDAQGTTRIRLVPARARQAQPTPSPIP